MRILAVLCLVALCSGCVVTVSVNILNNRSSQPVAGNDAMAENATTGGADVKPNVSFVPGVDVSIDSEEIQEETND